MSCLGREQPRSDGECCAMRRYTPLDEDMSISLKTDVQTELETTFSITVQV